MDVFISWSGERSRAAAEALNWWLPQVINAVEPWLSTGIDKGARWVSDVASRLEAAKAGIICLTPENLHTDWILFEAGALSKTLDHTFVCPFLIDLEPSDVKFPLAQFQATTTQKDDVLKLLITLNSALGDTARSDARLAEAFEVWWPKLDSRIKSLPTKESKARAHRPDRELLIEILELVRNQNRAPEFQLSAREQGSVSGLRMFKLTLMEEEIRKIIEQAGDDILLLIPSEAGRISTEGKIASHVFSVTTEKGKRYTIRVPVDIPFDDISVWIKSQMQLAFQEVSRIATSSE